MSPTDAGFFEHRPDAALRGRFNPSGYFPILLAAAILGVGIGVMACLDPSLSPYHPLWGIAPSYLPRIPFLWTATVVAALSLIGAAVLSWRWAAENRYPLIVIAVTASPAITGINIGNRDAFEASFALALLIWFASAMVERRPVRTPRSVLALLMALSVMTVVSVVNGLVVSILGLHTLIVKFLAVFLIVELVSTPPLLRLAFKTLVVICIISALVALGSEVLYILTGIQISFDDTPASRLKSTPIGKMLRATAFMPATQSLGHLLLVGVALVLLQPGRLIVRLALAGLFLAGIVATFSTGSYIAAGVVVILWPLVQWPSHVLHYLGLVSTAGLIVYFTNLWEKILSFLEKGAGEGLSERIELIKGGFALIQEYPVAGIGVRNSLRVLHLPVHNSYVQMGAELGIAGGVLFTILVAYVTAAAMLAAWRAKEERDQGWCAGLALGMIGVGVHFLSTPLANDYMTYTFFGLAISAALVFRNEYASEKRLTHERPLPTT